MSARADLQHHGEADALGGSDRFRDARDRRALRQRDAVTRQSRLEGRRGEIARRCRCRWRRHAPPAHGMEPQAIEGANGRFHSLQERKSGRFLRRDVAVADLIDHPAEADDRLVGLCKQLPHRGEVAPGVGLARHRLRPRHHVDAGIARHRRADVGGGLHRRRNADVERVLRRDPFLHHRRQRGFGLLGVVGNDGAFGVAVVVEQVDRAARCGDEADARSFRQPAAVEGERRLHQIVERAAAHDAVTLAHGEIGGVVAGDGTGVGLRGGLRLRGGAGLDGEDGLAHGERATGRMHERLRPADAFDEQHDLPGRGIVDDEIQIIGEIEVGLVAGGDAIGIAQPAVGRRLHPELNGAAGLEQACHRARRQAAQLGVGIAEQTLAIGIGPHAIGPGHAQPALGHELLEPGAACLRFRLVAVAHHRGIDGGGFHAGAFGILEHARHRGGGHDHQRMIDRRGQRAAATDSSAGRTPRAGAD